MSYPTLPYGVMVTIKNRFVNGVDQFGNDTYGFTVQEVGPCSIQQGNTRETVSTTDQVSTGMMLFAPYGTDISYQDAVIINGAEYEVTGDPESWVSPFSGHTAPVRVRCILVKGASV
jgi:hypothetical protein